MERWKMHKLGFVNFWLYEREEFLLDDGHLLLRGENGSGKSITTQSFIPFILDGDMNPVRLDPFGSRARRMRYYLLGEDEKEDSTGYLYLEFRKPDVREYLTIGIGLRARKNLPAGKDQNTGKSQSVDFWGFCLHDGRRIGPGDGCVPLYRRAEEQWLPLSKRELKKYMTDSPDSWAEAQKEYKAMVNRWLFQFRDIRQYDQLIQLLIKIRAPKLTRSALLPSAVVEILNDSLQVLTDDDLTSMVSAMKRMDELKSRLEGFRASMKDAQIIRNEYKRYNRAILGQKAKAFLDARHDADQCRGKLEQSQQTRDNLERRLREERERFARSAELLDTARRARDDLGEDDVSENQAKLDSVRERLHGLEEQAAQARENLRKAEEQAARQEDQLQDAGLLDALVVPTAYRAELEGLLAQSPDTFIIPGPAVEDPQEELVPDQAGGFKRSPLIFCGASPVPTGTRRLPFCLTGISAAARFGDTACRMTREAVRTRRTIRRKTAQTD